MSVPVPPLEADAYLQVEAGFFHGGYGMQARVQKVTQKVPGVVLPGCIVVKVRIRVPREAWQPIKPEAVIDVPMALIQRPIEVEAVDPS